MLKQILGYYIEETQKYNLSHDRVETGRKLVNLEKTDYYRR